MIRTTHALLICSITLLTSCSADDKEKATKQVAMATLNSFDDIKQHNGQECTIKGRIEKGTAKESIFFVASFGMIRITEDVDDRLIQKANDKIERQYTVTARYIEKEKGTGAHVFVATDFFNGDDFLHYFTGVRFSSGR